MEKLIVHFTIRNPNGNGGRKTCTATGCVCEDCYLCPFEGCSKIGTSVRAKATPAALSWLRQRRPNGVVIEKILTEKEVQEIYANYRF